MSGLREPAVPAPTARLRLREMTTGDVDDIARLDRGGSRDAAGWVAWQLDNYRDHGFGLWLLETHDGDFVGDCGLTLQPVDGEQVVEIGWHVRADLRRHGFASEAALAVLEWAHAQGIEHLVALIRPDNLASQGVARRLGMVLEREVVVRDQPALVFSGPTAPP